MRWTPSPTLPPAHPRARDERAAQRPRGRGGKSGAHAPASSSRRRARADRVQPPGSIGSGCIPVCGLHVSCRAASAHLASSRASRRHAHHAHTGPLRRVRNRAASGRGRCRAPRRPRSRRPGRGRRTTRVESLPTRKELLREDQDGYHRHPGEAHDAEREQDDHEAPATPDAVRAVLQPHPHGAEPPSRQWPMTKCNGVRQWRGRRT